MDRDSKVAGGKAVLGTWPTPVEPAPRLAVALGLGAGDLIVKRDDLTGLGGGGNKVRKLEHLCGAALARGATTLVTTGAAQSNHARLTAAAGAHLGLAVHLVLAGAPPAVGGAPTAGGEAPGGNLVLDGLLGATIHWGGAMDVPALEAQAASLADELSAGGDAVEVIPYGGTNVTSARGYVECAAELLAQVPDVAHVAVAVGSGGTMAGLVAGLGADRVLGVATGAIADPDAAVADLVAALTGEGHTGEGHTGEGHTGESHTGESHTGESHTGEGHTGEGHTGEGHTGEGHTGEGHTGEDHHGAGPPALRLRHDQVGAGYSELVPSVLAALRLAARTEGLVLDPVYTGRALAGLAAAVADGDVRPGQRTVLLHTGGLPGLFGHHALAELAR